MRSRVTYCKLNEIRSNLFSIVNNSLDNVMNAIKGCVTCHLHSVCVNVIKPHKNNNRACEQVHVPYPANFLSITCISLLLCSLPQIFLENVQLSLQTCHHNTCLTISKACFTYYVRITMMQLQSLCQLCNAQHKDRSNGNRPE